ncbi:hypothetical protein BJ165DRAFT_1405522 [Panaeolus papilionaceus]|nr:hypothetical protein BJ165DRAFT_1405522 [Panaeolus papilionaceus]
MPRSVVYKNDANDPDITWIRNSPFQTYDTVSVSPSPRLTSLAASLQQRGIGLDLSTATLLSHDALLLRVQTHFDSIAPDSSGSSRRKRRGWRYTLVLMLGSSYWKRKCECEAQELGSRRRLSEKRGWVTFGWCERVRMNQWDSDHLTGGACISGMEEDELTRRGACEGDESPRVVEEDFWVEDWTWRRGDDNGGAMRTTTAGVCVFVFLKSDETGKRTMRRERKIGEVSEKEERDAAAVQADMCARRREWRWVIKLWDMNKGRPWRGFTSGRNGEGKE